MSNIALITQTPNDTIAHTWANRLNIPLLDKLPENCNQWDFFLHLDNQRLSLSNSQDIKSQIYVELVHESLGYRLKKGGGRKQPLARACGIKPNKNPSILDLTAGLGKDGVVLASLGCDVTLIERHPIVAALLENGLNRAQQQPQMANICQHLQHYHQDSLHYLQQNPTIDVIYLDPMYPKRNKSALVKKSMQILQQLVGSDDDSATLLQPALKLAQQRVVVKRPKNAPPLANKKPNMSIHSKKTRYDVYFTLPNLNH